MNASDFPKLDKLKGLKYTRHLSSAPNEENL
jgi:hypothetical protein